MSLPTIPNTFGSGGANLVPGGSGGTPTLVQVLQAYSAAIEGTGANLLYTVGADLDWVDPNPVTVKAALDRLAAAVAGLLAAPIP